jgi:hypothetical protein
VGSDRPSGVTHARAELALARLCAVLGVRRLDDITRAYALSVLVDCAHEIWTVTGTARALHESRGECDECRAALAEAERRCASAEERCRVLALELEAALRGAP